jgi:hypothetical protein
VTSEITSHLLFADSESQSAGLYLFGEIINSILYTYGMLLVVSLPKMPTGWSIRLLTGWYWIYCLLLVVSYRASMTAILANPAPRVTIDTLKQLIDSKITCGGWGSETKRFFTDSTDEIQTIGDRFETTNDPIQAANKIAKGIYAYYDDKNFLNYIRVKRNNAKINMEFIANDTNITDVKSIDGERNLHIMSDCVVNSPISIGFHKNSEKWLNDAMHYIKSQETEEDEVKALMNLKKLYGAFIALAIGYFISLVCLIGEFIHWRFVVTRDPTFDKYALNTYYMNKNKTQ